MEKSGLFILLIFLVYSACSPKVFKEHLENFVLVENIQVNLESQPSNSLDLRLSVEALEDYIEVTWETESEAGLRLFEVERAIDTNAFESILKVEPFYDELGSNYLEIDKELIFNKLLTYRLKVIQKDTFIYSNSFELFIEKPVQQIELVNNPTKNKNYIQFTSEFESEANLAIYNADGLNHTETIPIYQGRNEFEVQIEEDAAGVYFLQFEAPRTIWIERILKIGS